MRFRQVLVLSSLALFGAVVATENQGQEATAEIHVHREYGNKLAHDRNKRPTERFLSDDDDDDNDDDDDSCDNLWSDDDDDPWRHRFRGPFWHV
ncbi:unnamed protein product [Phytophthora lilii]|uniref:Unnamed protein product n=1 Tax=Phytophthora lilii TaxID=2077276 RepID=A0A9W6WUN2_9STRA|nr:unnamed protein product [Phytophthora lilii]